MFFILSEISTYAKLKRLVLDGFANLILSMGVGTKDKARNFTFEPRDRFNYFTLDFLYAQVGIIKKIVNIIADDMTREGIDFISDDSDKFIELYKQFNIFHEINKALKYSILQGSGACILLINDGQEYDQPLNFNAIKSIDGIVTIDRPYFQPLQGYLPFKKVEVWNVGLHRQYLTIHESRMLIFDGEDCGERLRSTNNGHGESFIWCIWEAIENYFISHNCAPSLLIQMSEGVYKIKGLNQAFAQKNNKMQEDLVTRVSILKNMSSINNMMAIDSEEDYSKVQTNLSNVDTTINQSERRLCAEADIPHSRLLSESAGSSLGESGTQQKRDHYDNIKSKQENKLRPNLVKLNKIFSALLKTKEPEFIFNSLWQLDETEKSTIMNTMADVDQKYKNMGMPVEDLFKSRFGDKKYSINTYWSGKINNTSNNQEINSKEVA